ncbi:hypothetical protein CDD83_6420 [Cordyceps sp. RAO-2017]|nr:hypothetical protein CDD83_6420 [Cordyceps sp. RAO-2017]
MEKLLTLPKEAFEKYRRTKSHEIPDEEKNAEEAYHFTTMGDFMLRSQLDAYDKRLPGTGMFDLKTRAVVSIRMDVAGYEKGVGYEIRERFGNWESFEREYFDMIRAAFLKYSLQVRMGRMDGIFVAFHNTQRIFGFQYISLEEMDQALHETTDLRLGDQEFKFSIALLNDLMDRATKRFPGRTLRIHVETRPTKVPLTYFFAEPVTDEEMTRIQTLGRPSPEELEREIRSSLEQEEGNLPQEEENTQLEQQQPEERDASETVTSDSGTEATWAELIAKVDETVENDSRGIDLLRDAVQEAIEQYSVSRGLPQLMNEEYRDALVEALTAHLMKSQTSREAADRGEEDDNYQAGDPEPDSTQDRPQTEATPLSNLVMEATKGLDDGSQGLAAFQRMLTELTPQSKAGSVQTEEDAPDEDAVAKEVPVNSVSAESESTKEDTEPATDEEVSARVNGEDGDDASKVDIPDDAETADAAVAPDSAAKEDEAETASPQEDAEGEVLGMYVTIRNRVNDRYVERPRVKGERFDWSVEYAVETLPDKQTHKIYSEIKRRRKKLLVQDPEGKERQWHHMFSGNLPRFSKKGEEYREMRTQLEADGPIYVAWDKEPLSPEAISDAEQGRS